MRWSQCLMGWCECPLEALYEFWLMCSMRSHIHAWNMAQGWMTEGRFGSIIPRSSGMWKSHPRFGFASLMKVDFSLYLYEYYDGLYVVYMAMISLIFLSLLCWLCTCFMTTTMYGFHHVFILVIEWSMYRWPNGWNASWCVETSMVLSDSQLSMIPLYSKLLFTPVDYIFVICLKKFLSWLVGV